jgi:dTDP-4-dehydrorhamnose reductase
MGRFSKIMLTGIHGQVGYELQRTLASLGNVIALDRAQFDLGNADAIRSTIQVIKPDLIVNPAAYTAVDKAESEPELAFAINATAPSIIAEEAAKLDALLIHYSTDYVYDGAKSEAYAETDQPRPLGVYGKSKLAGEEAIRVVGLPHLILRTSWVYGPRGKNFLRTIIRLAQERESLRVVADQFGAPTSSTSIAEATAEILNVRQAGQDGTYHLSCRGQTSWHGFAQKILQEYEVQCKSNRWPPLACHAAAVQTITTQDYPTPAARPQNSLLDNSKLMNDFHVQLPPWQDALAKVLATLEPD